MLQQKKEQQKQLIQNFSDHITLTESISPDNEHIFINYQKQYKSKILPILSRSVTKDFVAVLQQIQAGKFPQNTKKILQKWNLMKVL
ncbi:MAG: hypothetical protein K6E76_04035 [Patescibacteria group bacterium]|nr:hypothetical protein [Patescibacteria group bacterium]